MMSHTHVHSHLSESDIIQFVRSEKLRRSLTESHRIRIEYEHERHQTLAYDSRISTIRRGTSFKVILKLDESLHQTEDLGLCLYTHSQHREIEFELSRSVEVHSFKVEHIKIMERTAEFHVSLSTEASIGLYHIAVRRSSQIISHYASFFVIFNPFHHLDDVHCSEVKKIHQYLFRTKLKIFTGNEHSHSFIKYHLSQFHMSCMIVCAHFLNAMKFEHRSSVVHVTRELTARVNANDDGGLLHGLWDELSEGRSPLSWVDAHEIYHAYITHRRSVKWGQCFVYSMLMTSMCRSIGILTRSVTGFTIGHDHDGDGVVTVRLERETMKHMDSSETLWNFHCWNQCLFHRRDVSIKETEVITTHSTWQHLDGTPQERSQGIFRTGPFPVDLVRRKILKLVPFDGKFIHDTINCRYRYEVVERCGRIVKAHEKSFCGRKILTVDENGLVENITHHYRSIEQKIPKIHDPSRFRVILNTPTLCDIFEDAKFSIDVMNSSIDSPCLLNLTVRLVNHHGRCVLREPVFSKYFVYEHSKFSISERIKGLRSLSSMRYEMLRYHWELRVFDQKLDILKIKHAHTEISSPLRGQIMLSERVFSSKTIALKLSLRNHLERDCERVHVRLLYSRRTYSQTFIVDRVKALSEVTIPMTIQLEHAGKHTIEYHVSSQVFDGILDKQKIEVI